MDDHRDPRREIVRDRTGTADEPTGLATFTAKPPPTLPAPGVVLYLRRRLLVSRPHHRRGNPRLSQQHLDPETRGVRLGRDHPRLPPTAVGVPPRQQDTRRGSRPLASEVHPHVERRRAGHRHTLEQTFDRGTVTPDAKHPGACPRRGGFVVADAAPWVAQLRSSSSAARALSRASRSDRASSRVSVMPSARPCPVVAHRAGPFYLSSLLAPTVPASGRTMEPPSPQAVRKKVVNLQRLPTERRRVCAGQGHNCPHSQRLPPERGEFELYYDI